MRHLRRLKSAELRKLVKSVEGISDWSKYVSPSDLQNYMLDDPVLDYFKIKSRGIRRSRTRLGGSGMVIGTGFEDFIKQQGMKFERDIYNRLEEQYTENVIEIDDGAPAEKLRDTLLAIENRIPIIYQGFLIDVETMTFGLPDLLIRNDWISKLFPEMCVSRAKSRNHYVVVDIKWTTLHFRSGNITLRKHGRINAYKCQLYVYNQALGRIQGYTPSKAYLWGRAWIHQSCNLRDRGSGDEYLGEVDFDGVDKFVEDKVASAIQWIYDLRDNHDKWTINPPSRPELYPNMKNKFDGDYGKPKKELAKKIKEITMLWHCGLPARHRAHSAGITRYDHSQLSAKVLGIGGKRQRVLDKILEINREGNTAKVLPAIIQNNDGDWQTEPSIDSTADVIEFFIDFETIGGFMINPVEYTSDRVFMIGIGHMAPTGKRGLRNSMCGRWDYKCFTSTIIGADGEEQIFTELYDYLESFGKHKTYKLYHWGAAEYNWLSRVCEEHPRSNFCNSYIDDVWINLHEMASTEPVVIRGATGFGLKAVTKALHDLGLINCVWDEQCTDGMNAMIRAWRCYKNGRADRDPRMAVIRRYNDTDCKAVYYFLNYLRTNHINKTINNKMSKKMRVKYASDDEEIESDLSSSMLSSSITSESDSELTSETEEYTDYEYIDESEDGEGENITEDLYAWIPGQCWFCGEDCDSQSQACGACSRKISMIK